MSSTSSQETAFEIPAVLESLETLKLIGFTEKMAERIWESFMRQIDPGLDGDLLDTAKLFIIEFSDVPTCASEGDG